jgi:hypothetical protein
MAFFWDVTRRPGATGGGPAPHHPSFHPPAVSAVYANPHCEAVANPASSRGGARPGHA